MMTCREALKAMRPILEKQASPAMQAEATAHFAACGECGSIWKVARESTCKDLADFLHDYLEGALQGETKEVFERHLHLCGECETYMETYRTTIELCREQPDAAPCRKPLPDDLVAAILAARAREKRGPAG